MSQYEPETRNDDSPDLLRSYARERHARWVKHRLFLIGFLISACAISMLELATRGTHYVLLGETFFVTAVLGLAILFAFSGFLAFLGWTFGDMMISRGATRVSWRHLAVQGVFAVACAGIFCSFGLLMPAKEVMPTLLFVILFWTFGSLIGTGYVVRFWSEFRHL